MNKTICINSKGGRKGISGLQPSRKDRIYDTKGIAVTIATSDFYNPLYLIGGNMNNLKIRKLTPKECWRLMGFDDEDFEKAKWYSKEETNKILGTQYPKNKSKKIFSEDGRLERVSNAQLYKQAGNSIVVNVLEAILKNLLFDNK